MLNSIINSLFGNSNSVQGNSGGSCICPNCKNSLTIVPKRKAKCPFCNKFIYVRTKQNIFPTSWLNKNDALAVDWLRRMRDYGLSEQDYTEMEHELTTRFGQQAISIDVIWGLFNKLIINNTRDHQMLSSIYYSMALFLYDEDKDPFPMLQESKKMDLLSLRKDSIKKVSIDTCGERSCENCRKQEGQVLSIKEALISMPVPCRDCTYDISKEKDKGFCRCGYRAEFD